MAKPYLCPICKNNGQQFALVYKMAQEITKDADSGDVLFYSDELESVTRSDGQPDLDVRCLACDFIGQESVFIREAQRSGRRR